MATRWGICSSGKISHDFTVALKTLPPEDHQVVAVAARELEDAQQFATKHSISRVYGSYEELARDPDIDVVYIGVIHPYHLSTCLLFTNAKKNVLCEKPLAMNTKKMKEILSSAKRNDVFLMEKMASTEAVASDFVFKWSKEQTELFIKLRGGNDTLFTGAKHSASVGWRKILEEMGLQGKVTPLQAKKKWDNLKKKYKDCKYPGSGEGVSGKPTAAS
ncbi:trans-1,2-dihydrobenzene-1,2-diol dehydrogenase-like isoform X2 [Gymnodraco acuticeps]|uniref:Trans-1,2-dihydrobenzene-1,2-diol dehydrogenase n=1 Tax=Gymnodraco acuticeps TaxID=8218 RepID=A0A6P8UK58_GYMAC|nr:trans-1,2-dihydrobenzene-1,2-diol dehydrogenase-like isoform X2 [Gymnodraco acuticeps]